MNNEQQELLDEVYENFTNSLFYDFSGDVKGYRLHEHLSQEEFINKCKIDPEFSERWGLKIEERELSIQERIKLGNFEFGEAVTDEKCDKQNIPTKLITVTYNDKTIESYD